MLNLIWNKMKKIMIMLLLVTFSLISYAQGLSASYTQIRESCVNPKCVVTNDGLNSIVDFKGGITTSYFFNSNNVCNLIVLTMKDEDNAKGFINAYNRKFYSVKENEWETNTETIKFSYDKDLGYVFIWRPN